MPDKVDVIVVGSGMAAVHAAFVIAEKGVRVLILDGGRSARIVPNRNDKDFESMREDANQHTFFVGEDVSSVIAAVEESHGATMASGNRAYVASGNELPLQTEGVEILQTLAKGGLSEAWGGVCAVFNDAELAACGIPASTMHEQYQSVMHSIGVSGEEANYRTQPASRIDVQMQRLLTRQAELKEKINLPFRLRQPLLGLLTRPHKGRHATNYHDLDFYLSDDTSLYRARYTLEELEQKENVQYVPYTIVSNLDREQDYWVVKATNFNGKENVFYGKAVVLAAGAVGSTRIAAASGFDIASHMLIKRNKIIACLNFRALGKRGSRERHSLCQLTAEICQAGVSDFFAHVYTYGSLLLWKLSRFSPLPMPETMSFLALFAPALVLVDARFAGEKCAISYDGTLHISEPDTHNDHTSKLKSLRSFLRRLFVVPLKTISPPFGASIHYAGGIPVQENGEIVGVEGVFVADSAGWTYLPAKPPALTIMANARRIGEEVLKKL